MHRRAAIALSLFRGEPFAKGFRRVLEAIAEALAQGHKAAAFDGELAEECSDTLGRGDARGEHWPGECGHPDGRISIGCDDTQNSLEPGDCGHDHVVSSRH